jgi:hypothetical protein
MHPTFISICTEETCDLKQAVQNQRSAAIKRIYGKQTTDLLGQRETKEKNW